MQSATSSIAIISLVVMTLVTCRPQETGSISPGTTWHPPNQSAKDWERCRGLPCQQYDDVIRKMALLNMAPHDSKEGTTTNSDEDLEGDDILLNPRQVDTLLSTVRGRQKRKVHGDATTLWPLPVWYKFDGAHSAGEQAHILKALDQWKTHTCIRFAHATNSHSEPSNQIIFTKFGNGCYSYVGRAGVSPQQINLPELCFRYFGTAVHEVGHALGLWHEHQRPDRDEYITIETENLSQWAAGNFMQNALIKDFNVPYDYSSLMHYGSRIASKNGKKTIRTKDPIYQRNLGQREGLSFLDAKIINLAYCSETCAHAPALRCQNGGYQNPNDCRACRCPLGLTGRLCDVPDYYIGEPCGGEVRLTSSGAAHHITSPGYGARKYRPGQFCSWMVKASPGERVRVHVRDLSIRSSHETCYSFLQLSLKADLGSTGARLCGSPPQVAAQFSEAETMLIVMKVANNTSGGEDMRGFSMTVTSVKSNAAKSEAHVIEDISKNTRRTSTTLTPTTTTSTTTTTQASTTKHFKSTKGHTEQSTSHTKQTTQGAREWSTWSSCGSAGQCQCGGCRTRERHRLCDKTSCDGSAAARQVEQCTRPCHAGDQRPYLLGRVYMKPCPQCCEGYALRNGQCVPTR